MKLKPCPFCGGEAGLFEAMTNGLWVVQCKECGIGTLHKPNMEGVVNEWNRRELSNAIAKMPEKITERKNTSTDTSTNTSTGGGDE